MVALSRGLNISKIEELYRAESNAGSFDILLNSKYEDKDFFTIASLSQFIFSWLRKYPSAKIILPFSLSELDQMPSDVLRDFVKDEINYLAIISGWPRIHSKDGEEVMFKIQEHTRFMRGILNSPASVDWRALKGNAMILPCFDQFSNAGGHVNSFYYAPDKMYSLVEFTFSSPFAHRLSYFLKSFNFQSGVQTFQSVFEDLCRIVYELMANTHQWARTDGNNRILNPNSRGVYLKVHKAPPSSFQKDYRYFPGISEYFSSGKFSTNNSGEMYALEVSVYDSGPGYVKRYLGANTTQKTTAEHVDIVKHCLCRHTTSARGGSRVVKGVGLDKVMQLLSDKGLFRIRTQDCSIYRNMRLKPYREFTSSDEIEMFDWNTASSTVFTTMPEVEGVIFSIIYPLS
jgi:hypothetical protein